MSRAAFEAWAAKRGKPGQHFDKAWDGTYKDNRVAAKWAAWQAARNAALEEAAQKCDEHGGWPAGEVAALIRAMKERQ